MILEVVVASAIAFALGGVLPQPKWAQAIGAWIKAKFFSSKSAPTVGVTVPGPQDTNKPV